MQKIVIPLEPEAWHGYVTETVWAERVGEGRYRLRSVPFYAKGIGVEDIVTVDLLAETPVMREVSLSAGHSTYRIFVSEQVSIGDKTFEKHWKALQLLGCTYERATEHLVAVDVPAKANIHKVYELLEAGERAGTWTFEEGHCGHGV
jgi:hypothetical protein